MITDWSCFWAMTMLHKKIIISCLDNIFLLTASLKTCKSQSRWQKILKKIFWLWKSIVMQFLHRSHQIYLVALKGAALAGGGHYMWVTASRRRRLSLELPPPLTQPTQIGLIALFSLRFLFVKFQRKKSLESHFIELLCSFLVQINHPMCRI